MELEKESRSLDASRLDAYNIYEAMHFSNGGGVYKATIISSGKKVILKKIIKKLIEKKSKKDEVKFQKMPIFSLQFIRL